MARIDWPGNRLRRWPRPRNGPRTRVHVNNTNLTPVRQIIRRRVDPHRATERAQPGLKRGNLPHTPNDRSCASRVAIPGLRL
jgi:hypothetical protein